MTTKFRDWLDDELSALTGANTDATNDKLAIVDDSADATKRISPKELVANTASFLQSGTGAALRSVQEKLRDGEVSLEDFNTTCDGTTDNTTAFQAAVDTLGSTANTRRSGITLVIPGPTIISSTITIQQKSFTLRGNGWGRLDDTNGRASYLRWTGAAGSPMLKLINCEGGMRIQDLAFKGNTGAKPSAAIELNQAAGIANSSLYFENLVIGSSSTGDDPGDQFVDGITTSGLNANNAEQYFNNINISGCSGRGINQGHQQNGNWNLNHIGITQCGVGVQFCSTVRGGLWVFSLNDVDIKFPTADDLGNAIIPRVTLDRYFSEQSGRMLYADNGNFEFVCYQGDFAIAATSHADGRIVYQESTSQPPWCRFEIHDFTFLQTAAPPGAPHLAFKSKAGSGVPRFLIFDGVRGWETLTGGVNGLDITTQTNVDGAFVYLRQFSGGQTGFKARLTQQDLNGVTGRNLDITSFYTPYSAPSCRLYDDFLGPTIDATKWASMTGSDPQVVAFAVSAGTLGGMVRGVTGDDAAASMAVNGVQLQSGLNWRGDKAGLKCRFRVKMSAITNICYFFGLTDQIAALEMPFTLAAGDVLTSNATDAFGVLFDTAADTDNWWLVGVANNVDATKQNSAVAPTADTYETWEIEISTLGEARFYRAGVLIGTTMTGAVRTTILLTPVVAAFSRGAASRNIDADKVHVEQDE